MKWASRYHSTAVSLCVNVKSKVQGKTLQNGLISRFCRRKNFSPVSATGLTLLKFLLCNNVFCIFLQCDISAFSAAELAFLNFLLCSKVICCAVKFSTLFCNVNDYSSFSTAENISPLPAHK